MLKLQDIHCKVDYLVKIEATEITPYMNWYERLKYIYDRKFKKMPIAKTTPPYYAVIFTSIRAGEDDEYLQMAIRMEELAAQQPGYLGIESARNEIGITVSYWESPEAIKNWKQQSEHLIAQQYGREKWYAAYRIRICKVEKEYGFEL